MSDKSKGGTSRQSTGSFAAEEQAAIRERAREARAARNGKAGGEADVLAKIAELPPEDRQKAEHLHALIKQCAPELTPRTWYGMPAYARSGEVVCFFSARRQVRGALRDPRLQRQGAAG
jgi:hypothetical protein